jgi:FKBP-type peptidyl-prolyl cis-trans isomerase FkpA
MTSTVTRTVSREWLPGVLAAITIALTAATAACGSKPSAAPAAGVTSMQTTQLQAGSGAAIAAGQIAVVQYTGWLYEVSAPDDKGKQFDSSRTTGQPFRFALGTGQVIKGWDQGVVGMKIGERRRLVIPPDLAYGDSGAGGVIPPGATLVFDVDLVAIE